MVRPKQRRPDDPPGGSLRHRIVTPDRKTVPRSSEKEWSESCRGNVTIVKKIWLKLLQAK
jgi:hypothetical protein